MKILVLGAYESNNLGDAVICECVAKMLKHHFPDAQIMIRDLLSRDRSKEPSPVNFKVMKQRRIKDFIRRFSSCLNIMDLVYQQESNRKHWFHAYLEELCNIPCDLVVFAGGQMFMDSYTLFLSHCVSHFEKKGIPVIFNACGVGPSYSRKIKNQLKETLSLDCVKYISCRDDADKVRQLLSPISKSVTDTFDPALGTSTLYNCCKKEDSDIVGLGIMYPNNIYSNKTLRFWKNIIQKLDSQNIKWKLFTNGAASDYAFAKKLLSSMPDYAGKEDTYLCPRNNKPEDLVLTISKFNSIISFRLHSHIIAASMDIPSIAIVWDKKIPFFFEKIGCPNRYFTVKDSADSIFNAWMQAKKDGYNRSIIDTQALCTERLLVDVIRDIISKGGIS